MPGWVPGVVGTIAVSAASAYVFLRLRCRRIGPPFGPRAKWPAAAIVAMTAIISTGLGLAAVAVGHHLRPIYVGLVLPSGLWLGKVATDRGRERGSLWATPLAARLSLLRRLDDRMGEDMQSWCDDRLEAASKPSYQLAAAARFYCDRVDYRLKDDRARAQLNRWRRSIAAKMKIVHLIDLGTTLDKLHAELRVLQSKRGMSRYSFNDPHLRNRLVSDAANELSLLLASIYRLGYHREPIYPIIYPRPSRKRRRPPASATDSRGG
jgi:hypothetical protein